MIEKLLANPFTGDGTLHPDLHLIYVDEVCGLFNLAGIPGDFIKKKVFPLSVKEDALTWYRVCDDTRSWNYNRLKLEFHQKFYPMHLVHRDRNYIYNFWPCKGESIAQAWGDLSQCYIHAPILSPQEKLLYLIFMLGFLITIAPCSILLVLALL